MSWLLCALEASARVVIRHLDIQQVNTQGYDHGTLKRYAICAASHGKILVNSALFFYSANNVFVHKVLSIPTKYRLSLKI